MKLTIIADNREKSSGIPTMLTKEGVQKVEVIGKTKASKLYEFFRISY